MNWMEAFEFSFEIETKLFCHKCTSHNSLIACVFPTIIVVPNEHILTTHVVFAIDWESKTFRNIVVGFAKRQNQNRENVNKTSGDHRPTIAYMFHS
jgi:hypothetical protein